MKMPARRALLMAMAILFFPLAVPAAEADDVAAIKAVIAGMYDKPGAIVQTAPVVVQGDYAVASWTQGEKAGRALLQRQHKEWRIHLCAGRALRTTQGLRAARVPAETAERLQQALQKAEGNKAAVFDRFDASLPASHPAHAEHHPGH